MCIILGWNIATVNKIKRNIANHDFLISYYYQYVNFLLKYFKIVKQKPGQMSAWLGHIPKEVLQVKWSTMEA